jgi:hypothetical protein
MSTAPDEFEKLQKLLKLKRHEQPPPGFFDSFPTRVINRLEREAAQQGRWADASWLMRLLATLETNPMAAGLFGMSVCGLLISGIAWSQYRPPSTYSDNAAVTINMADNSALRIPDAKSDKVDSLAPSSVAMFGTNGSVFDTVQLPSAERVNFQLNQ